MTPASRNEQFSALCQALGLDRQAPDILDTLRDTSKVSTEALISGVLAMGDLSTFRGVVGTDGWVRADEMQFQQNGGLAKGLWDAGVRCVISGDVKDEASDLLFFANLQATFYQIVHPCKSKDDILSNLCRYYPLALAVKLISAYTQLSDDASPEECDILLGRVGVDFGSADAKILADGQVHLPVRLLAKDLAAHDFPVIRYAVEKVAEALGSKGIGVAIITTADRSRQSFTRY